MVLRACIKKIFAFFSSFSQVHFNNNDYIVRQGTTNGKLFIIFKGKVGKRKYLVNILKFDQLITINFLLGLLERLHSFFFLIRSYHLRTESGRVHSLKIVRLFVDHAFCNKNIAHVEHLYRERRRAKRWLVLQTTRSFERSAAATLSATWHWTRIRINRFQRIHNYTK